MSKEKFPKIYNFLLSEDFDESCLSWGMQTFKVQTPSYDVLFEHTIGVIWHLFAHNGRELFSLNRVDIAWALKFLEAIDLTNVSDTTDLDALKTYMRNVLIVHYSLVENEKKVDDTTMSGYESSIDDNSTAFLHSYNDFMNCSELIADIKKSDYHWKTEIKAKCTDDEILKRLQILNPSLKTLDDVKQLLCHNEKNEIKEK